MGTSQSQPTEQPNKATERVTEATPEATPSSDGSKLMAIEKTAADQAKLSANHRKAAVVKEANPSPSDCKPPEVEKAIAKQAMLSTNSGNHQAAVVTEAKPTASNNCFMVYARDLSITWSEDNRYWQWPSLQENSGVSIEVAELLNVCWLEVHGKFETAKLSPGTLYEVIFVAKLKATTYGWEAPVNLRLTLPDGSKQWRKVNLMEIPTEQWAEIPIGEFRASHEKLGSIEFSLYEYEGGKWKKGLVIKGVAIRPKK